MADNDNGNDEGQKTGGEAPDLSFIPEQFKAEDGSYKLDEFSGYVSELSQFKTAADERAASMPADPSGYGWSVPEDHQFLDGFNGADFPVPVLNDKGEPVIGEDGKPQTRPMTAADMIDPEDPDIPLLQEAMHAHGADPALVGKLASIMANRELRNLMAAGEAAREETRKLGPDAPRRTADLTRAIEGMLPGAQAKAVMDSVTSADALRGLEALIQKAKVPPSSAETKGFDLDGASNKQLIAEGLRRQMSSR